MNANFERDYVTRTQRNIVLMLQEHRETEC